jgi:hypothetical protein
LFNANPKEPERCAIILSSWGFYRQFTKNISGVAQPITDLTQNRGLDCYWGPLQVVVFQQLKDTFTSRPVLKYFDPALDIIIETNTSNFTICHIQSQKHKGKLHHDTYHWSKMKLAEKN